MQAIRRASRAIGQRHSAPLVVVTSSEVGHIVSELSPFRVPVTAVSNAQLAGALAQVATYDAGGITVVTSP
jgi:hypothetical protein